MGKHPIWNFLQAVFLAACICACSFAVLCAPARAQYEVESEELILAVTYPPYVMSAGILAVQKEGMYYLPAIEMAGLFDFYIDPELERGYISGYFKDESNSYFIDAEKGEYGTKGEVKPLPGLAVERDPFGEGYSELFVRLDILNEIWPVDMRVDLAGLFIEVAAEERLPFELRLERQEKQAMVEGRRGAQQKPKDLPYAPNPYKLIGPPAIDLDVEYSFAGATRTPVTRSSFSGVQDFLGTSLDYSASVSYADGQYQRPESIRTRFSRYSMPGYEMPLRLKRVEAGDTSLPQRDLIGNSASGRGVYATTFAQKADNEFDEITVEGTGVPGWEVEIYRNDRLLEFGLVDEAGEYRFENIPLEIGNNQIRIVLYGPQGQVEERIENHNVGGGMIKPGQTEYTVGLVDADRPFFLLTNEPRTTPRGVAGNAYVAHGLNKSVTVFGSATKGPTTDQADKDKQYASAGITGPLFNGMGQAELYKQAGGGEALDVRYLTQLLGVRLNLQSALFQEFESQEAGFGDSKKTFEGNIRANANLRSFLGNLGLQVSARHIERENALPLTTVQTSQTLTHGGLRLTMQSDSNFDDYTHISSNGRISASVRMKQWQFRSQLDYAIYPDFLVRTLDADVRFRDADGFSAAVTAQHSFLTSTYGAGFQIGYDFRKFLGSLDLNWIKEGGLDVLLRASTSLGPYGRDGKYIMSSDKLSRAAPVQGRVFMDRDGDGVFSEGDEPVPEARLEMDGRKSTEGADEDGFVVVSGGENYEAVNVEVDKGSLADPYFRPAIDGYSTVPRPGSMIAFDFPIIETGSIDGTVMREDGSPISGMRLELVNDKNEVVMTSETAYDGFYTFEFVAPGTYQVRADPTYGVNVPPETVTVASDDLFAYGIDLQLLEQAAEAKAVEGSVEAAPVAPVAAEPVEAEPEAAAESGGVAHTHHETSTIGTVQPAPLPPGGDLSASVKRVRIGEHPDKVRLVLDLSGPIAYRVKEAEDGSAITVDLPGTGWQAIPHWRGSFTPVLESFTAEALPGGGTRLTLKARSAMALGLNGILGPADGQGHRLFIDVQARK